MTKDKDYRETIEEHRQQVTLDEVPKRRTRTKRKKKRNPFMTLLVCIFILIPAAILAYVVFLYDPSKPQDVAKSDEAAFVQFEKNDDSSTVAAAEDDKDKKEKVAAEEKAKAIAETKAKAEQEAKAQAQAKAKAEADAKAAAEQKATAEAEAKAEAEAAEKAAQEQAQKDAESLANAKSHVVQSNETLYRIAMNYYHSPDGVEKIKQANNLANENISVGQTLIIPQ